MGSIESPKGIDPKAWTHYQEGLDGHLVSVEEYAFTMLERGLACCESPIEQMMLAGLMWCKFGYCETPVYVHDHKKPFAPPERGNIIAPQHAIGSYRADFAVFVRSFKGLTLKIAIECDGHDFHEKTKEQAQRDKARDRFFVAEGWAIFRFTGSEIVRDLAKCLSEIDDFGCDFQDKELGLDRHKRT